MRNCQPKLDGIVKCAEPISMERIKDHAAAFGSKHGAATGFFDVELTAGNIQKAAEEYKQIVLDSRKKGRLLEQWVATDLKTTTDERKIQKSVCNDNHAKYDQHISEINEYKPIVNHPTLNYTLETFEERLQLCEKLKQNDLISEVLLFVELLLSKIKDTKFFGEIMMFAYGLLGDSTEATLGKMDSVFSENFIKNRTFFVDDVKNKLQAAEEGATLASKLVKAASIKVEELKVQEDRLRKNLPSIENMTSELKNIQQLWEETASNFEHVKESMKNLMPPIGKLSTENGCTEAELAEFQRSAEVLMLERNRVISDAVLYKLVYLQLVNQKLTTAGAGFLPTNREQMKKMPDVKDRLLMAEKELQTLVLYFRELEKSGRDNVNQQTHQTRSNIYSRNTNNPSTRFSL